MYHIFLKYIKISIIIFILERRNNNNSDCAKQPTIVNGNHQTDVKYYLLLNQCESSICTNTHTNWKLSFYPKFGGGYYQCGWFFYMI